MYRGKENQEVEPYVRTHSGIKITFLNIRRAMVKKQEMAWHLGRTCRFHGLMYQWYSNAEHSLLGSKKASTHRIARQFLVHDVGEMIHGDIASPVGRLCPEFKALCHKIQAQINVLLFEEAEFDPEVKEIDTRICATEQRYLRNQPDEDLFVEPYKDFRFQCWEWHTAMMKWLDAFNYYFPEWKE